MSTNRQTRVIILLLILLSAFIVVKISLQYKTSESLKAIEGLKSPNFTLNDRSGSIISLDSLKGNSVFLNFWATWCKPCRDELPSIQTLYNEMKEKPDFRLYTVLYNENLDRAVTFMKKNGYDFPVLLDNNGKAAKSFGVTGVPETYLIDSTGVLSKKIIGPLEWDTAEARELLNNLQ